MSEPRLPLESDWIRQDHVDLEGLWDRAVFRLHEVYDVAVRPGWRLELAEQPWAEVWLIQRGRCQLVLGDQEAVVAPGQLAILRPGRTRRSWNGADEVLALVGFGCSVIFAGAVDLLGELELPLVLADPGEELRSLVRATVGAARGQGTDRAFSAPASAQLALAKIVNAAGVDLTEISTGAITGTIPRQLMLRPELRAVLDLIAERFAEPLDLRRLAESAHLSPKHLARTFRDTLGTTPMAYLRRYRLLRSSELLITTARPITRIAHDCGFTDSAHFSRAFRAQFGVSASRFRDHARSFRSTDRHSGTSPAGLGNLGS
ncbi:AraC family transcriptional regulator [Microlunatus parietis]|uniref:AraC-like DNA-binding protein n=1 Tax=Microlunatus parietis TaxID=682979 RepID=A0A7Y9I5K2_9ACTN|nr:AraC family transcriptional regulator [Microlunatus parietis]NYE70702.1 AraC-like DNA-binding protein [Microlunatus parietis]